MILECLSKNPDWDVPDSADFPDILPMGQALVFINRATLHHFYMIQLPADVAEQIYERLLPATHEVFRLGIPAIVTIVERDLENKLLVGVGRDAKGTSFGVKVSTEMVFKYEKSPAADSI